MHVLHDIHVRACARTLKSLGTRLAAALVQNNIFQLRSGRNVLKFSWSAKLSRKLEYSTLRQHMGYVSLRPTLGELREQLLTNQVAPGMVRQDCMVMVPESATTSPTCEAHL